MENPIRFYKHRFPEEVKDKLMEVLDSGWWTYGDIGRQFEAKLGQYIGVKHAFVVSNCTLALRTAYRAIGLKKGHEVIVPSMTFTATVDSIIAEGGTPVFADIEGLQHPSISPDDIKSKITSNTYAICVVHYAGYPCDMKRICDIAKKHDLYLIEDCAHSIGATYNGKKLGSFGNLSCFSFYANKNLPIGEGGAILTDNDKLANFIRLYRYHGIDKHPEDRDLPYYDVIQEGTNYKLPDILSCIGLNQLQYLDEWNERRREIVREYRKQRRTNVLFIPFEGHEDNSACHLMPIILPDYINRTEFIKKIKSEIEVSVHYLPVHQFLYYREKFGKIHLPFTEEYGKHILTLPLYPSMSKDEIKHVVEVVESNLR